MKYETYLIKHSHMLEIFEETPRLFQDESLNKLSKQAYLDFFKVLIFIQKVKEVS